MAKLNFSEKNIVITGASKGIGKEVAKVLASQGANLFLLARGEAGLKELAAELSTQTTVYTQTCDVSDKKAVDLAIKAIQAKFSTVTGLINNAGTTYPEYFEKTPLEEFERVNAVDYLGSVYMTHGLWSNLEDHGFISFTSSVVGYMGVFGFGSYAGPKFALFGLAETISQELASRNISVSILCPPDTETPGFEEEEKTKPHETRELSKGAKLMTAEQVSKKFIADLKRRKFVITCNFESALYYRLTRLLPAMVRMIMKLMVNSIQKKMK
jgi:3-dehydrosphinganine reductase